MHSVKLAIFLVIFCSMEIEGLLCFKCMYISGLPANTTPTSPDYPFDKSCEFGKSPNQTLSEACPKNSSPDTKSFCAIIQVKGLVNDSSHSVVNQIEVTLRACMLAENNGQGDCMPYTAGLIANISNLPPVIDHIVSKFEPNTPGKLCLCDRDNCNGAAGTLLLPFQAAVYICHYLLTALLAKLK